MPHKNLNEIPDIDGIAVMLIGLWGAIMNYFKRKHRGYKLVNKLGFFVLDILTSGGIAVITYLVLEGYFENAYISVGVAGVFAHQGTRAFYILEQVISQKLGVKL